MPAPAPDARSAASARLAARGFAALAAAIFALIVLGAVVRAHGAGLACPDWPLCFGSLVPRLDFRVALEWGHRLLAGSASLGFVALWLWTRRVPALCTALGRLPALGAFLLGVQVVLGGLTVLLGLAPWTVTAHLLCGNAFCALLVWCARVCADVADPGRKPLAPLAPGVAATLALVASLLGLQLVLGGLVSSHYAGLACSGFPTCDGHAFVPGLGGLVGLHVLHRLNGYALVLAFAALALCARRQPGLDGLAWNGLRLVLLQVAIGVANVLLQLPVEVTALHSALATGLVLVTALLVREALLRRTAVPSRRRASRLEPA